MLSDWHIRLFLVNTMEISAWWNVDELARSYWRLYLDEQDGANIILRDGTWVPLAAGQVYLLPEDISYGSYCAGSVTHRYVHFDVLGLPQTLQRSLFDGPFVVPPASGAILADRIRVLPTITSAEEDQQIAARCAAKAVIFDALAARMAALSDEELVQRLHEAQVTAPVEPALRHIADHLAEPLSVAALAALCCMSGDHFIRRFRTCVGETPARYVQEQRLLLAAQLLLFTDHTIDRIAQDTGFGNRFYFSRAFKRYSGQSPAAYRQFGPA